MFQRRMQQMRGGVIGARCASAFGIDTKIHRIAKFELAARDPHDVDMQVAQFLLGIGHGSFRTVSGEYRACVADLTSALTVERRLIGNNANSLAGHRGTNTISIFQDCADCSFGRFRSVTQELRGAHFFAQCEPGLVSR